jgi:hypothetical protein
MADTLIALQHSCCNAKDACGDYGSGLTVALGFACSVCNVDTGFTQAFAADLPPVDVLSGTSRQARKRGSSTRVERIAAEARIGVDAVTGLATDFLNQFNEVAMLLDMLAEDASLVEDLEAWQARDYVAHFSASDFADRHLVLEAYELSPPLTRRRFDALCGELTDLLAQGLAFLSNCRAVGAEAAIVPAAQTLGEEVRRHLDQLDMLIHAGRRRPSQSQVGSMFASRRG